MGSYIKALLLLIVLVVLVTFGIKNNETMVLHFYFQYKSIPIPVYAVVYGALIIGVLIGMIVGINARFTQRKKIRQLQKENRDLKNKVVKPAADETAVVEREGSLDETQNASLDETQVIENDFEDEEKLK